MEHTLMLLQDAHEGDKAAREQLVRENMGAGVCGSTALCGKAQL